MRHPKSLGGLVALAVLASFPAFAQDPSALPAQRGSVLNAGPAEGPFANRGGSLPPVISSLQVDGVKIVSLGEESGVRAYLAEAANGRFQTLYVTPDNEHVVAGLMFQSGGANLTGLQVARMMRRFNAAAVATPGLDTKALNAVPDEEPAAKPDDQSFVDWMRGTGAKLTPFLDRDGGLDGYLVESKASEGYPSKMQPFYVFPGGKLAVAGILIRRGGVFVTGLQIHALQQRFAADDAAARQPKVSEVVPGSANPPSPPKIPDGATVPPEPVGVYTGKPGDRSEALPPAVEESLAHEAGTAVPAPARPVAPVAQQVPQPPVRPAVATGPISDKPVESAAKYLVNAPDKAEFLQAARSVVWFSVGVKDVPAIWMVADPQCPFCHETWRKLKPLVFDGKLQVRIIMIAGLKGSDPYVRSILSRGEPIGSQASGAWLQGEGSINNVAIQAPPTDGTPANESAKRFVAYNTAFAQKYQITRTPYLFYTVPTGDMYASVGVPDDLDAFLAAVR